jgi:hypothetical protein
MCAGISFKIDKINPDELDQFFLPAEFDKQRKGDLVETFYWQNKPFLPVEEIDGVRLYAWGNKDKNLRIPKTGWARIESVRDSLWDWLSPQKVIIPCEMGYEKRKWFKTPEGLAGVRVRYSNITRVYLLTTKADQQFMRYTGHDRMPVGKIEYL